MPENKPTPPSADKPHKSTPERLLASFVRPAFHGFKTEGKKDRGTRTKPVDSDEVLEAMPVSKAPGSPIPRVGSKDWVPQGPEPRAPGRQPVRKITSTRLPSRSAQALRNNPDHVYEPHLHKRRSGGYFGLFFVLIIGFGFVAYTFGFLPLDKLFDQGNAAVQSHNDQVVAWITHVAPIVGIALVVVIAIGLLRRVFFGGGDD